jgi:hypothetical protein
MRSTYITIYRNNQQIHAIQRSGWSKRVMCWGSERGSE